MKRFKIVVFVIFVWMLTGLSLAQEPLNLLTGTYPEDVLKTMLLSADAWHPFPRIDERARWESLPECMKNAYVQAAEGYLGCEWETPKASVFLDYVRDGNRSRYQKIAFDRRAKLALLILGECCQGEGRYLDDILNGIWTICEETYWGVPAHVGLQKRGVGLADVTEPTVDLFAAETGMLLAWTDYLVGEKLDSISPLIRERIGHEIDRRILTPCLEREDFWWMGYGGRIVNNWNPWICSNWLTCVLLMEKDPDRRVRSVYKILQCLDHFLNPYPKDGGCDEGPSYWSRAGGSLFDCLELLQSVSRGRMDVFHHRLVQEIGRYIHRAYISGPYFINFADAPAKLNPDASLIYRYGKAIQDESMMGFGAFLAGRQNFDRNVIEGSFGWFGRVLPTLFHLNALLNVSPKEPLVLDFWLPDLQVMGARSREGSNAGLFLAAKGGHNAESHNHNDVGNFIVYTDGYPAVIDAGVETYTAKTFSSSRYEIWTMQSVYHNLPTINGVMQMNGRDFEATRVSYRADQKRVVFQLNLEGAYPEEAKVKSWQRTLTLNRGREVILSDRFSLEEVTQDLQLSLMSWRAPVLEKPGVVRLENPEEIPDAKRVAITYDENRFVVDLETIRIEDQRLRSSWGERVYRILFTYRSTPRTGAYTIRMFQEK